MLSKFTLTGLFLLLSTLTFSQKFFVDTTFGNKRGISAINIPNKTVLGIRGHQQQSGKFIVVGVEFPANLDTAQIVLARFQTTGKADSSFGINGIIHTGIKSVGILNDNVINIGTWVVFQADDKIAILKNNGITYTYYQGDSIEIYRFTQDGLKDNSFNGNGKTVINLPGKIPFMLGICVQADGKILASGGIINSSTQAVEGPIITRVKVNGMIDTSFGTNGILNLNQITNQEAVFEMYQQNNGKILLGGDVGNTKVFLTRLNDNGTIDATFGTNGLTTLTTTSGLSFRYFYDSLNDKIYLVDPDNHIIIYRFNGNGSTDNLFNGGSINYNSSYGFGWLSFLNSSKCILSGSINNAISFFTKYSSNGKLDSSFGLNGMDTLNISTFNNLNASTTFFGFHFLIQSTDSSFIMSGASGGVQEFTNNNNFDISCAHILIKPAIITPLKWLDFAAVNNYSKVKLNWTTANEFNTEKFIIERGIDNINFKQIGSVKSKDKIENSYNYADNLENIQAKTLYYRLKQIDKDGKFAYSIVVSVKLNNITKAEVYPNPITSTATVKLQLEHAESVQIKIVNSEGKLLSTKTYNLTAGNNQIPLNTSGLTSGVYAVVIAGQNVSEHLTFSKQ